MKKILNRILFFLLILSSNLLLLHSQEADTVYFSYYPSNDLMTFDKTNPVKKTEVKVSKTFQITIHLPTSNSVPQSFYDALSNANSIFGNIGFNFKVCDIKNIINPEFKKIDSYEEAEKLRVQNYDPGRINIYLLDSLAFSKNPDLSNMTWDGGIPSIENLISLWNLKKFVALAYSPKSDIEHDAIMMDTNFSGNLLIELLGIFFGLYRTDSDFNGKELVDGSNCNTSGDLICDTPAAADLFGKIDINCNYTGNAKDSKGAFYVPHTNNYMSGANKKCRCHFTEGQYNRMLVINRIFKQHLK